MSQILLLANRATSHSGRLDWLRGLIVTSCATALILARTPIGL